MLILIGVVHVVVVVVDVVVLENKKETTPWGGLASLQPTKKMF